MKNTVEASPVKEGRSDDREWVSLANASKRALDQRYEATFTVTTDGLGTVTTIWDSGDMPINSAWEIQATVLCRVTNDNERGRFVVEGLFYRDSGVAVQEGATLLAVAITSDPDFDVQFAISGNGVILTVEDPGGSAVTDWSAMIKLREVRSS